MTDRMDAVVARQWTDRNGEKRTAYTRIGIAFPLRNGGWSINLEALPLPTMGERGMETRILLMPPKQDKAPASAHPSQFATDQSGYAAEGQRVDLDDEVPFAPEWR